MRYSQLEWRADGITFFGQVWAPEASPRAVVALVHGLGEHSERYAHVGEALARAGYALMAFDLRGHGRSTGQRGHTPSLEAWLDDIARFLQEVGKRFPGRPQVLYGHSLGGGLVLNYVLRRGSMPAGVIATGPGLRTSLEQQPLKIAVARIMKGLLPRLSMHSGLSPATICRDPRVVKAYTNDPLVHDLVTPVLGMEGLDMGRWALAHAAEFPAVPLLLMQGTADTIGFAESTSEFASKVPGNCTLKVWEGFYHEVHNEPGKAAVLAYMVDWLNRTVAQA